MKMMTKKSGGILVALAVAVGLAATPIQAQRGFGGRGQGQGQGPGPYAGNSIDVILEYQEALDLTSDQLRQVEALKATVDSEIKPLAEEMNALREQVRAGEVEREEGARRLQALRGRIMTAAAPLRGRVQEILTVEQHRILQRQVRAHRPGAGRGDGAFQGRGGMRSGRGQMRGSRGGFGPRQGFNGQGRAPAFGFRQAPPAGQRPLHSPQGRRPGRGGGEFPTGGWSTNPLG